MPEQQAVGLLIDAARLSPDQQIRVLAAASAIVHNLRETAASRHADRFIYQFFWQYPPAFAQGNLLLRLAQGLLRIPDIATRDALIADTLRQANWAARSDSSTAIHVVALVLQAIQKLYCDENATQQTAWYGDLARRALKPLMRRMLTTFIGKMSSRFVPGQNSEPALARSGTSGFRYAFGTAVAFALSEEEALRAVQHYADTIHAIGHSARPQVLYDGPLVSLQLSALHPGYVSRQHARVMRDLYPRLLYLAGLARTYDIPVSIDAEQCSRTGMELDLLTKLCGDASLAGWNGIGITVQAYQKRAPDIIARIIRLADQTGRRIAVRLVRGSYWRTEIKRAQSEGLDDYPVFTRKAHTDISYLACARLLLSAPDHVYPQFATHNAHSIAFIREIAGDEFSPGQYEFQCRYGVGEYLYASVVNGNLPASLNRPCRIHAVAGDIAQLVPDLLQRLLDGSNDGSFIHRLLDHQVQTDALVRDPVDMIEHADRADVPAAVPLPFALYGTARRNSSGMDLSDQATLRQLVAALTENIASVTAYSSALSGLPQMDQHHVAQVNQILRRSVIASHVWRRWLPLQRADILERCAALVQDASYGFNALAVHATGKSIADTIAEWREAVDALRYYAAQIRLEFSNDTHQPLGVVACISPWHAPIAAFTSQVGAALAAGNAVVAVPAQETAPVAAAIVDLMHRGGVPEHVLQLLCGTIKTSEALMSDARVDAVLFSGSSDAVRSANRIVAARQNSVGQLPPFICATDGLNVMIADSSAPITDIVSAVIASAFDGAGQRHSSVRLLCLQDDIAQAVIDRIKGAMAELRVAQASDFAAGIVPAVVNRDNLLAMAQHVQNSQAAGYAVFQGGFAVDAEHAENHMAPALIEIDRVSAVQSGIFGPLLHVMRYASSHLPALMTEINAAGNNMSLALYSHIAQTIRHVAETSAAGRLGINKMAASDDWAGSPLFLRRLLAKAPLKLLPGAPEDAELPGERSRYMEGLLQLRAWLHVEQDRELIACCDICGEVSAVGMALELPGVLGEKNMYRLLPVERVLCIATSRDDYLFQLAFVLAAGSHAIWLDRHETRTLFTQLPGELQQRISFVAHIDAASPSAALLQDVRENQQHIAHVLASADGPVVSMQFAAIGDHRPGSFALERLLRAKRVSINTSVAGGVVDVV